MASLLKWEDLVQIACQGFLQLGDSLLMRETDIELRSSSIFCLMPAPDHLCRQFTADRGVFQGW